MRARPRESIVLVLLHAVDCDACRAYLDRLAATADRVRIWGGRVLVVVPEPTERAGADGERPPFTVLADPNGEVRRRCGLDDDAAAVIVADRWGVVYHAVAVPDERDLPSPDAIEEWLRFLATQCAECGVPDEPGYGEWGA